MLIGSKQKKNMNSQVTAFHHEAFWGVFPWDMIVAVTPLVAPQSRPPHHNLPVLQSGGQVCRGEACTTLAHRGAVLI